MRYLTLILIGVLTLGVSCKDDKELIPEWESAVTAFGEVTSTNEGFVYGDPTAAVTFNFRWVSVDGKNTVSKIEFYVGFDETYVLDGVERLQSHGKDPEGDLGVLMPSKTLEGGSVPSNRQDASVTITPAEVYALFSNLTFDYDGEDGPAAPRNVFDDPFNPDRTPTDRFVKGDVIRITWKLTLTDGRVMGAVNGEVGWSPSTCTELPGSNCEVTWKVN